MSDSSVGRVLCMQQCLYFTSLPPYSGTSLGLMLAPSGSALCLVSQVAVNLVALSPVSKPILIQVYLGPAPRVWRVLKRVCVCVRVRVRVHTRGHAHERERESVTFRLNWSIYPLSILHMNTYILNSSQ